MRRTTKERFFEKINKKTSSGCWVWNASLDAKGYGRFNDGTSMILAHRFSYQLFNGKIPKGMFVCHSCDNPKCVNPDHLWLGTNTDNMRDASSKGRLPKGDNHFSRRNPEKLAHGEKHHLSKLTEKIVKKSRLEWKNGATITNLAFKYGINAETMREAIHKITWKHVI